MAKEFHSVYVYDMRGNQRTSGVISRREGGQTFGSGSRAGVAVLLLVKRPNPTTDPAIIHYYDIGDYLTRAQKLETVGRDQFDEIEWTNVTPNEQGDWINQTQRSFPQSSSSRNHSERELNYILTSLIRPVFDRRCDG